jgi:hypothetical protein
MSWRPRRAQEVRSWTWSWTWSWSSTSTQLRRLAADGDGCSASNGNARGSALECAAIVDAFEALEFVPVHELTTHRELVERIVSMLTRMARG